MSGMAGAFTTTIWNTILEAKRGRTTAMNRVLEKYRAPVVRYLRSRGHSLEDAEDLVQEVFLVVVRDDLLAKADRERSRFRTFLLAIVMNVLSNAGRVRRAAKRGGGADPVHVEGLLEQIRAPVPDETFDAEWIRNVFELALQRLRETDERFHRVLSLRQDGDKTHEEIGAALNLTAKQAANLTQAARKKLRELIRCEIQDYCSSSAEYRDEVEYLKRFLAVPEKP